MSREFFSKSEESAAGVDYAVAAAGTPVTWTGGTVRAASFNITEASGVVTLAKGGFYKLDVAGSVRGENAAVVETTLFKNGIALSGTETLKTEPAAAAPGAVCISVIHPFDDGDTVSLRFDSDTNADDVAVNLMCLTITEVGGT